MEKLVKLDEHLFNIEYINKDKDIALELERAQKNVLELRRDLEYKISIAQRHESEKKEIGVQTHEG